VQLKIEPENLGCRFGPVEGINWFFGNETRGIVLEDDIEASPAFFEFCDRLLENPTLNPKIGVVSGYTPVPFKFTKDADVYLSKYSHTWGWATWSDVWFGVSQDPSSITRSMIKNSLMTKRSHGRGIDTYWWDRVKLARDYSYDIWDVTFGQNLSHLGILSYSPKRSLVKNVGFVGSSSHTSRVRSDLLFNGDLTEIDLPKELIIDKLTDLDWAHDKYHFGFGEGANYWPRLKSKVYYYLNIIPFGKKTIKAINRLR
jgi:hypothetical protein